MSVKRVSEELDQPSPRCVATVDHACAEQHEQRQWITDSCRDSLQDDDANIVHYGRRVVNGITSAALG